MFGFPIPLYDSGSSSIKMTTDADSGFIKPVIRETFYSIKDGNWTDITVWQTASGRVGLLPTVNDDVYIRTAHTITTSTNSNYTINNFFVSGSFINGNSSILNIIGGINAVGTIALTGNSSTFSLYGLNNYINPNLFSQAVSSFFTYSRNEENYQLISQQILPLNYGNLYINNNGIKYLTSDLTVFGNLTIANTSTLFPTLELGNYNLTVNGTSTIGVLNDTKATLSKIGSGNILFIGNVSLRYNNPSPMLLSGNPNVEFRGGITSSYVNPSMSYTSFGTGTFSFTTNNQSINIPSASTLPFSCKMSIADGITLSIVGGGICYLADTINGQGATSKLLQGASAILTFATSTAASSIMTTGIADFTTNANTIQFYGNYSTTIPSNITTFRSLTIGGTGTKTLGVNTTINAGLTVISNGTFDLGAYNIDVIGTTTINTANLNKTGTGSVLFRGLLLFSNSTTPKLNFSGGNPTVELRAGIQYGNGADPINSGTGQWSFTTSNQEIRHISGSNPVPVVFNCPILIASGITVTATATTAFSSIVSFNNLVNGADGTSKLISSNNTIYLTNISFAQPMTTGVFDITTNANTLCYTFNGNYTIPYTSFSNLTISGTGTKTLSGNTTINANLNITVGATFELSTFNLTVLGTTTTSGAGSMLSKNGAGNIIFTGLLYSNINFSGNPTVELKGGMNFGNNTISTGTGQWTFSTNNQSLTNVVGNAYTPTFSCSILISGITLTTTNNSFAQTIIITGVLNGTNGSSIFRMGTGNTPIVNYQNATQPMATGILDTSTNLNTWIYGLNNQAIKGGASLVAKQVYRNLTLNGTGVKTLQGYVSVLNTYTLTSPATLALNGFTLTNP